MAGTKMFLVEGVDKIFVQDVSATTVATFASLPSATDNAGTFAITSDTSTLYVAFAGSWCPIALLAPGP